VIEGFAIEKCPYIVQKSSASKISYQMEAVRMSSQNKKTLPWLARALAFCAVFAMVAFAVGRVSAQTAAPTPWVAPDNARMVKNPVPATPENLAAAAQNFKDNCVLCHGEKGMGDGPGGKAINVKPEDFTDSKLMSQETDGSLFWKMTEGRGPMPAWKEDLSETERWQLVDYIRKLNKDANSK
jgi:mono/diheme cytochrome c family protein